MVKRILPHLCLVISVMMLTFYVIDKVNPAMNFIGNDLFKTLLLVYVLLVIATSIILVAINRRSGR